MVHRRTSARLGGFVLAFGLALVPLGCGGGSDAPAGDAGSAFGDGAKAVRGGTLVVVAPSDLDTPNPLVTGDVYTQEVDRYLLYLPLVRYTEDLDYAPALARSWDLEGDSAVVFHLRHDVRWHDGQPVTAADVAFTFQRMKDPATAFPGVDNFAAWHAVSAEDSFTVRFSVDRDADPLAGWPLSPIAPRHLLDTIPPERLRQAEFSRHPVGDGPFRFVSRMPNDNWIFEANPDFPEELGGRPNLDRIVWRVVPDGTAQLTELRTGAAQLVLTVPGDQVATLRNEAGIRVIERPSLKYSTIVWNERREPFADPHVRRGLTMAIDRQRILDLLRAGAGTPAAGPVAPGLWQADTGLQPLPFDTGAATRELAQAGYARGADGRLVSPDGKPLSFELMIPAGNAFNADMAEMIRSDLEAIGVTMKVRPTDWAAMIPAMTSKARNFDAVLLGWEAEFRPNLRGLYHSASVDEPYQMAGYANPAFDAALVRAENANSRAAALPAWHEAERILRDDQPWSYLYYYPDLLAASDRLEGVDMDVRGIFRGVQDWWLAGAAK